MLEVADPPEVIVDLPPAPLLVIIMGAAVHGAGTGRGRVRVLVPGIDVLELALLQGLCKLVILYTAPLDLFST